MSHLFWDDTEQEEIIERQFMLLVGVDSDVEGLICERLREAVNLTVLYEIFLPNLLFLLPWSRKDIEISKIQPRVNACFLPHI